MPNPKDCRDHAFKCSRLADTFADGPTRQMFLDMAQAWLKRATDLEKSEERLNKLRSPEGAGLIVSAQPSLNPSPITLGDDADASGGPARPASGQGGLSSQLEACRLVPLSHAILQRTATPLISADAKLIMGRSFEQSNKEGS